MDYGTKAEALFQEGYNCAQAVILAFAEELHVDPAQMALLSSSFGGGMGRLREVCGAVSGMFMVAGLAKGYNDPKDYEAKQEHYARIQRMAAAFKKENGSIICRELLSLPGSDRPTPEQRTEAYYKKRPCGQLVACAARIAAKELGFSKGEASCNTSES